METGNTLFVVKYLIPLRALVCIVDWYRGVGMYEVCILKGVSERTAPCGKNISQFALNRCSVSKSCLV